MKRLIVIAVQLFSTFVAMAQNVPFDGAAVSFKVVCLDNDSVVASYNSSQSLTPASITKLLTTAGALGLLGEDFHFTTEVGTDSKLENGTIKGNVIVRGDVDPTMESANIAGVDFINQVCANLYKQGVRKIEGDIIVDALALNNVPQPGKWTREDIVAQYGAGAFGASVYDNQAQILLESTKTEITIKSLSHIRRDAITLEVQFGASTLVDVSVAPFSKTTVITGTMRPEQTKLLQIPIINPPLVLAEDLKSALQKRGIEVRGSARVAKSRTSEFSTLYKYRSPRLSEILKVMNFKSNNIYAEHLFRRLGCLERGINASSSVSHSVEFDYFARQRLDTLGAIMYDGCGLAPQNAMSADFMCRLLAMASRAPWAEAFENSLPTAGKEGTVKSFLNKAPIDGYVKVKSGSMAGVQSYAGYIYINNGPKYAFCVIVNNFRESRGVLRAEIADWLVNAIK